MPCKLDTTFHKLPLNILFMCLHFTATRLPTVTYLSVSAS